MTMTNTYAYRHLADIGRANPVKDVQAQVKVPSNWTYGQATKSLVCFDSKTKAWQIKVRIDHLIDVEGYGRSKRYRYKDSADAVRIVHACFETYQ